MELHDISINNLLLFKITNPLLIGFTILSCLSLLTDLTVLILKKKLNTFNTIKKIIITLNLFVIVLLGITFDNYIIQDTNTVSNLILLYYIAYSSIRVLDNSKILGIPIPDKIVQIINDIRK